MSMLQRNIVYRAKGDYYPHKLRTVRIRHGALGNAEWPQAECQREIIMMLQNPVGRDELLLWVSLAAVLQHIF